MKIKKVPVFIIWRGGSILLDNLHFTFTKKFSKISYRTGEDILYSSYVIGFARHWLPRSQKKKVMDNMISSITNYTALLYSNSVSICLARSLILSSLRVSSKATFFLVSSDIMTICDNSYDFCISYNIGLKFTIFFNQFSNTSSRLLLIVTSMFFSIGIIFTTVKANLKGG